MLGDEEDDTLKCAERVEKEIQEEFFVTADQSIDTEATDSSYEEDPDDQVTLYMDKELVDYLGCDIYIEYGLDEVDNELPEICEVDVARRFFRGRKSWRRRHHRSYWRRRSK